MAELQTLPASAPLETILNVLDADGGVIVEDLLSSEGVAAIVNELAPTYGRIDAGSRSGIEQWEYFHGPTTKRFTGLAARSRAFVDHALLNPTLLSVADHALLPSCSDYWLNTGQVMAIGPGEAAQVRHRDEGNWPEAVVAGKELTVSCMFALSKFTVENGATVVWPGSHRQDHGGWRDSDATAVPLPGDLTQAVMTAGSGLIYSGKVVHGAGRNASDDWRYGMHVSFVVGWLRPEEASPLMVDRNRAQELPERARELLGWSSYHSEGGGRTWLVDFEDARELFANDG